MCFVVDGVVFTGDTLLIRGTGRTDFPAATPALNTSRSSEPAALPDATRVYPAHDYRGAKASTIGEERRHNPRLQARSRSEYIALMANLNLAKPARDGRSAAGQSRRRRRRHSDREMSDVCSNG